MPTATPQDTSWAVALCERRVPADVRPDIGGEPGPTYQAEFHGLVRGGLSLCLVDLPAGRGDPFADAEVVVEYRDPVRRAFSRFATRPLGPLERQADRVVLHVAAPDRVESLNSRRFYRVAAEASDIFAVLSGRQHADAVPARVADISGNGAKLRLLPEVAPAGLKVGADVVVRFEGDVLRDVPAGHHASRALVKRLERERGSLLVAVELIGPPVSLQDAIVKYVLDRLG